MPRDRIIRSWSVTVELAWLLFILFFGHLLLRLSGAKLLNGTGPSPVCWVNTDQATLVASSTSDIIDMEMTNNLQKKKNPKKKQSESVEMKKKTTTTTKKNNG